MRNNLKPLKAVLLGLAALAGQWAELTSAQPFPGGLPACQRSLGTCIADLGTCNGSLATSQANLATCNTTLGTCTASLGQAQASLDTCNTNLSTCAGQRNQLQASLNTCVATLAQTKHVLIFYYTGGDETFTVPPGIRTINLEAWGAGGGGGVSSSGLEPPGGGGGGGGASFVADPFGSAEVVRATGGQGGGGGVGGKYCDGHSCNLDLEVAGAGGGGGGYASRTVSGAYASAGTTYRVRVGGGGGGARVGQGGRGGFGGGGVGGAGGVLPNGQRFGGTGGSGGAQTQTNDDNGGYFVPSNAFPTVKDPVGGRGGGDGVAVNGMSGSHGGVWLCAYGMDNCGIRFASGGDGAHSPKRLTAGAGGQGQPGISFPGGEGLIIVTMSP